MAPRRADPIDAEGQCMLICEVGLDAVRAGVHTQDKAPFIQEISRDVASAYATSRPALGMVVKTGSPRLVDKYKPTRRPVISSHNSYSNSIMKGLDEMT